MKDEPRPTSWWHTLPGMLTALAGVITAITGLIIALNQLGVFRGGDAAIPSTESALVADEPSARPSEAPAGGSDGAGTAADAGLPTIEAAFSEVPLGEARYEIRGISLRRNDMDSYRMTLAVRLHNDSQYDLNFWDRSFRLFVDSVPRAPVGGLSVVGTSRAATDGDVVFEVPSDASSLVLRISYYDTDADLPLRIARH